MNACKESITYKTNAEDVNEGISDYGRVCRCINPPDRTPFKKENLYKGGYTIDGYYASHGTGSVWSAGEIVFLKHFQILSGKWES